MSDRFGSQTDISAFDVDFTIISESGPIIFSGNKLLSFFNFKIID